MVPGGEVVGATADGRRVVALVGTGGYAEQAVAPEALAWDVPDAIDDVTALGMVIQGASAWVLLRRSAHLAAGESVVVHAAAMGRDARRPARQGVGRRTGHRHRLVQGEARPRPRPRRRRRDRRQRARTEGRADRRQRRRRVDIVLEMTGGTVTDQSLRALAPFAARLLRDGLPQGAVARPAYHADGALHHHLRHVARARLPAPRRRDAHRAGRAVRPRRGRPAPRHRRRRVRADRGQARARGPAGAPHHRQARPGPSR